MGKGRICLSEDVEQQGAVLFLFGLINLATSFLLFRGAINEGKH